MREKEIEVTITEKMHHTYSIRAESHEDAIEKAIARHKSIPFTALDSIVDDKLEVDSVECV